MKCALDLMVTATAKAEEIAREKAEREAREKQAKIARTIIYCEELGVKLEEKANRGEKPEISFVCDEWYRPLVATNNDYVDGRTSYNPQRGELDLDTMAEWFASYCFEMVTEEFCFYRYSWGYCSGYKVMIVPKPACID